MNTRWPTAVKLAAARVDELIETYELAAEATERLVPAKDQNAAADCVARVYDELRRRGIEAQRALIPLTSHRRPGVRGWASAHALEFEPSLGERRLRDIAARDPFPHSFNAELALKEWRAGRLRFPASPPDAT
jgi:Domain of unknown function (DUF2019)